MSKLIGTDSNQVPSNADLGSAAFMDKKEFLLSNGSNMAAIDAVITDTAVDIFIYDTRKDSDGGAWRHRTQHTSWYNERLNTPTRGARREFPAIAVIVAESKIVTIYDGDDPNLPMWLKFDYSNSDGSQLVSTGDSRVWSSVAMLNGRLAVGMAYGTTTGMGVEQVDFILDKGWRIRTGGGSNYKGTFKGSIAERRLTTYDGKVLGNIPDETVDDVAMTVLPDALVDIGTGLPTPTVAVATPGGVSVIHPDFSISDITAGAGSSYNGVSFVNFSEHHYLIFEQDNDTNARAVFYIPVPTSDRTTQTNDGSIEDKVILKFYDNAAHTPYPTFNGGGVEEAIAMSGDAQALRSNSGDAYAGYAEANMLTLLEPDMSDKEQGRVAFITADHNTGWMTGDNRLSILSNTDAGVIDDTEIVSNHDFSNGTTDWAVIDANEGSISASGGQLTLNNTTVTDPPVACYQAIDLEVGKHYTLETDHASGAIVVVNIVDTLTSGGGNDGYGNVTYHDVAGSKRRTTFRATSQTNYVVIRINTNAVTSTTMNSVSITEAEPGRGPYSRFLRDRMSGFKPVGRVKRHSVAPGADLVSYSGFDLSNYFTQHMPWTIGTGEFCFQFWVKPPPTMGGYFHCISIGTESTSGQQSGSGITLKLNASDATPYFYTGAGGASQSTYNTANNILKMNSWNCIVGGRLNNRFYMYINGVLRTTGSSNSFNISDSFLTVGRAIGLNEADAETELALMRISKTFPDAEHIRKMYEDEKQLFQPNAKATLYGTSDAVKAFAYDSTTKLLHAGTSDGRSVFQGLRRVDNTTTAVGTAMSASNGMVAED